MKKIIILIFIFTIAAGLIIFFKKINLTHFSEELKLTFLNVGQGDATLIILPNDEKMLVDCGRDAIVLSALGRNLFWSERNLDYLVITHPDADHFGGCLDVLKRYQVKHIYVNGFEKEKNQLFWEFKRALNEEISAGADATIVYDIKTLTIASTTIDFLYPDHPIAIDPRVPGTSEAQSNNTSIVLKITYNGKAVLLTGDMETPLEAYLLKEFGRALQSDILKIGHHGSQSSSGENFLQTVGAKYCVISVGVDNSYGHPSPRVLNRLSRLGCKILRTDVKGDILLTITTNEIIYDPKKSFNE